MHDQVPVLHQRQRLAAQPVEQHVAVRRLQDRAERVAASRLADAMRCRQQMQVVISEDRLYPVAHAMQVAQGFQRLRTAVDQVADEHAVRRIAIRLRRFDPLEQFAQSGMAALQVADYVGRHQ